jgi:hypothetical protein
MGAQYIYNSDQMTAALNFARIYILLNYYIDEFCVSTSLSFTSGKATIPPDYLRWVRVYDSNGTDFTKKNVNDFDKNVNNTWTIKDDSGTRKIFVYPSDTTALTMRYIKLPADMASTSDESGFGAQWKDAHCLVAAWWLLANDRQPEAANKLEMAKELLQASLRSQSEESEELTILSAYFDDHLFIED